MNDGIRWYRVYAFDGREVSHLVVVRIARPRQQRDRVPSQRQRRAHQRAEVPRVLDPVQREEPRDSPRFRQRADADDRRHGELSHGVDPVHRLEPGGLLEDVLGGADDPARGHAGRHVRVLREEERQGAPDAIDARDSTANLREDPRAGDDDGAALLAVAAVAHELGEVFDRRVVGARDVLLASRGGCDEPDAAAPHAVPRLSRTIEWNF